MRDEQAEGYLIALADEVGVGFAAKKLQLINSYLLRRTHFLTRYFLLKTHTARLYLHFTISLSPSLLSSLAKGMTGPTTYLYEGSVDRQNS